MSEESFGLPEDEEAEPLRLSRGRGASDPTLRIYDILHEHKQAGGKGLTLGEIVDAAVKRFNRSGVHAWWETSAKSRGGLSLPTDYRQMCRALVMIRLNTMRMNGQVANVGEANRWNARYAVADPEDPPRWWRPRVYRPGEYVPYSAAESRRVVGTHMRGADWLKDAHTELAKPRSTKLRELVKRAIDLIQAD
jgi:hypothetical protein